MRIKLKHQVMRSLKETAYFIECKRKKWAETYYNWLYFEGLHPRNCNCKKCTAQMNLFTTIMDIESGLSEPITHATKEIMKYYGAIGIPSEVK